MKLQNYGIRCSLTNIMSSVSERAITSYEGNVWCSFFLILNVNWIFFSLRVWVVLFMLFNSCVIMVTKVSSPEHYVCEPWNVCQLQIFDQIQHLDLFFLKEGMQNQMRRANRSCRNNAIGSALESWGLFRYYIFTKSLDIDLSELKENA